MLFILLFAVGAALTYYAAGISKVPAAMPSDRKMPIGFLILSVVLNLAVTGVLVLLVLLGASFSTPKGEALVYYTGLMLLTIFQCTLLWLTVLEAKKIRQALWLRFVVFLLVTCGMMVLFALGLPPYVYMALVVLSYVVQVWFFRYDRTLFAPRND